MISNVMWIPSRVGREILLLHEKSLNSCGNLILFVVLLLNLIK
jgi:hypothetical protein